MTHRSLLSGVVPVWTSQEDESRVHSADAPKAYSKLKTFNSRLPHTFHISVYLEFITGLRSGAKHHSNRDERTVILYDPDPVMNFWNSVQVQPTPNQIIVQKINKIQIFNKKRRNAFPSAQSKPDPDPKFLKRFAARFHSNPSPVQWSFLLSSRVGDIHSFTPCYCHVSMLVFLQCGRVSAI